MKRILSLLLVMIVFASCEDDVKFNNPAVQGFKDNEVWKADDFTATIGSDNTLTVTAHRDFETLVLRVADTDPGTYTLGGSATSMAHFEFSADGISNEYSTMDDLAGGQIRISPDPRETNLTGTTGRYITGTFTFLAVDSDGYEVSFQKGWFYKVPIVVAVP